MSNNAFEMPMRVVIVEDNSTNLAVLSGIVSRMDDVLCVGFTDPGEAMVDLRSQPCDLVIVDFFMPGLNGLELIQAMRSMPQHAHVPVVMITADADRKLRLAAIASGATDFLTKPVEPVELRCRATNLLALRKVQNMLAERAQSLKAEVDRATENLQRREEEVVYRLARAIEFRDNETSEHVGRVAHDWLFPRMSAVIHHGGAGTTAAALRAGVPSIVVPFTMDQPFWARRTYQLGVGPQHVGR